MGEFIVKSTHTSTPTGCLFVFNVKSLDGIFPLLFKIKKKKMKCEKRRGRWWRKMSAPPVDECVCESMCMHKWLVLCSHGFNWWFTNRAPKKKKKNQLTRFVFKFLVLNYIRQIENGNAVGVYDVFVVFVVIMQLLLLLVFFCSKITTEENVKLLEIKIANRFTFTWMVPMAHFPLHSMMKQTK